MTDTHAPDRRRFLFGAAATLVAAPAIVRVAANLMPVSTRIVAADDLYPWGAELSPEDASFIEGMSQTIEAMLWYGNGGIAPVSFNGFIPDYEKGIHL